MEDYNDFYKTSANAFVMQNIPGADTLANWENILSNKYDQHSITSNPQFVDPAGPDRPLVRVRADRCQARVAGASWPNATAERLGEVTAAPCVNRSAGCW